MKFLAHVPVECPDCKQLLARLRDGTQSCSSPNCQYRGIRYELPSFDLYPVGGLVKAAAADEPDVVSAMFTVNLPTAGADGALPTDIQWMPPGKHPISAEKNGKPYKTVLNVTAQTAARVQADFEAQMVKAKAGEDDYPYLDFNHNDEEASAHPTEFYWAGDDPQTGGVRCKVAWTDAGASAVKGRSFRRFSPQFKDDGKGNVTGLPVNAGGLVNRAAFKKIQAIAAKHSPANDQPEDRQPMKKLLTLLKGRGLITDTDLDETDLVTQVSAKLTENETQIAKIAPLETEKTRLEGVITKAKETHATSVVENLVKCGAIPPKDDKVKARYIKLLIEDPENEAILPNAPASALGGAIVKAKRNEKAGEDLGTDDYAEPLITKAKEMVKANADLDLSEAIVKACEEDEEAYNAFRYSSGLGDEKSRKAFATGRN